MPNYTWNTIKADDDVIKGLLNEEGKFDFNKFEPCPPELVNTTAGSRVNELMAKYILETFYFKDFEQKCREVGVYMYKKFRTKRETLDYLNERIGDHIYDEVRHGLGSEVIVRLTGKDYYDMHKKYGCHDWYNWNCRYWGTKWNAFDVDTGDTYINFTTAWSAPEPIFQKICAMYPDRIIEFESEYEDNLLVEGSNYHGQYIEGAIYEHDHDNIDWDNYDEDDDPWINIATGVRRYA